jgi:phenylpyruvate tautomerase PptA (4-oxalocrotonate tautomerase family)
MTSIILHHPEGRVDLQQRRVLAQTLTDAVLTIECGQMLEAARVGFQVHFRSLPMDCMGIGGRLIVDMPVDILLLDVAVMDAAWTRQDRAMVINGLFAALAHGLGVEHPSPTWWIQFRIIEEGSWGSRGGALSILDLLETGAFTPQRAEAIRRHHQASGGAQSA